MIVIGERWDIAVLTGAEAERETAMETEEVVEDEAETDG